jgi:hypothetical protein
VLAAGVVGDQIQQHADVAVACLGDEAVQIGESAEIGVDVAVVADVIAPVAVGGRHTR